MLAAAQIVIMALPPVQTMPSGLLSCRCTVQASAAAALSVITGMLRESSRARISSSSGEQKSSRS